MSDPLPPRHVCHAAGRHHAVPPVITSTEQFIDHCLLPNSPACTVIFTPDTEQLEFATALQAEFRNVRHVLMRVVVLDMVKNLDLVQKLGLSDAPPSIIFYQDGRFQPYIGEVEVEAITKAISTFLPHFPLSAHVFAKFPSKLEIH
ncbi:hypothetical protein H696_01355 [Fonticula alba]|uniref:Thioredoxin domain-containing protein n=1 Tax=Fonticula alba TaxID=691883 RepID=A0A058ZDD4_FONAL|nr:hypothetical protein H696_01355 [Fonticula alba]KCV71946.1 hypothetical protein H696_01355 [Fonticula alba]|eukprot:XP_009493524.1 hypothetical protein H696_01355 [Fonticula alba]